MRLHNALRKDCKDGLRCRGSRIFDEYLGARFLALYLGRMFSPEDAGKFEEALKSYWVQASALCESEKVGSE